MASCSFVEYSGVSLLSALQGSMSEMRSRGRKGSLGKREEPINDAFQLSVGELGQAFTDGFCGKDIWSLLECGVFGCQASGGVWFELSG